MNVTLVPIIPHKWLSSANIVARYATVFASFVWAAIVFRYEKAFTTINGPMASIMHENWWAVLMLVASIYIFFHTKLQIRENFVTLLCNGFMTGVWGFTVLSFVIYWAQLPPGGFSASLTVFLLSCMNSLAVPKRE